MEKDARNGADKHIAFYIETLVLLAVFALVAVVLAKGFLLAERLSKEAEELSKAVHLAENAAEMAAASKSGETLFELLNEKENAYVLKESDDGLHNVYRANYDTDMMPAKDGIFYVEISWDAEKKNLAKSTVSVCRSDRKEPLYTLDLAVYIE